LELSFRVGEATALGADHGHGRERKGVAGLLVGNLARDAALFLSQCRGSRENESECYQAEKDGAFGHGIIGVGEGKLSKAGRRGQAIPPWSASAQRARNPRRSRLDFAGPRSHVSFPGPTLQLE